MSFFDKFLPHLSITGLRPNKNVNKKRSRINQQRGIINILFVYLSFLRYNSYYLPNDSASKSFLLLDCQYEHFNPLYVVGLFQYPVDSRNLLEDIDTQESLLDFNKRNDYIPGIKVYEKRDRFSKNHWNPVTHRRTLFPLVFARR